jgi:hypothetical protein
LQARRSAAVLQHRQTYVRGVILRNATFNRNAAKLSLSSPAAEGLPSRREWTAPSAHGVSLIET